MRGVIGMETSGAVRDACVAIGLDAISVDLLPAQVPGPHHVGDVFEFIDANGPFDFGVFHPECTYHTLSAAWAFGPGPYHQKVKPGTLVGEARHAAREAAERDVERIMRLPFVKIIENPRGTLSTRTKLGPAHQVIQPYQFGSDASKGTCLWFFDAEARPMLGASLIIDSEQYVKPRMVCDVCDATYTYDAAFGHGCAECGAEAGKLKPRWANQTNKGQNRLTPGPDRWQVRSNTYPGIAKAMAEALRRML